MRHERREDIRRHKGDSEDSDAQMEVQGEKME